MWIIFSTRLSEHQRESIQWEYCLFLIIPSSKGRASNVNIVSTWLSRAPKEEHPRGILPLPDYPELQRKSIQGEYCLDLIIPSFKGRASKGNIVSTLYLIIPSSKGRASKGNIASIWLSRAPKKEHPRGILPLPDYPELKRKSIKGEYCLNSIPDYPELQRKSIQEKYCLYLIIPSSKGRASMEKTDVLLGLTTVGIILSYFSASSPGSSRSQPVPWSDIHIMGLFKIITWV